MSFPANSPFSDVDGIAARYGVSRKQVYNWLDLAHPDAPDRLPSILVPPATRLFDLEQTDAWIRTHSRWSLDMDPIESAS